MKKILKITGFTLLSIAVLLVILGFILNKPLPDVIEGKDPEKMANRLERALNKEAWDSTVAVSWNFANRHQYIWDKKRNLVLVKWDDYEVYFNTQTLVGNAYENGVVVSSEKNTRLVDKAWTSFANDSFWLIAPYKLRDPGTIRKVVDIDGEDGLMVQYTSGGVTPGDTYVWLLGKDNKPREWKLWVKIIPVGGVTYSWENWLETSTGAIIALTHRGFMDLQISDLRTSMDVKDFNNGKDPFTKLTE